MSTRYLAQNPQFIDELMRGQRAEAPIIVTTKERACNYPDKHFLLDLYDVWVIQLQPKAPLMLTFRKPTDKPFTNTLDHSDLIAKSVEKVNSITAGDKDQFISVTFAQLMSHYLTHTLISLEAEAGVQSSVEDWTLLGHSGAQGFAIMRCMLAPAKTWEAVKWSPFVKGERFTFHMGFVQIKD